LSGTTGFDFLIEISVGGSGDEYQIGPSPDQVEQFRSHLESILASLAQGETVNPFPSYPLRVSVDRNGLHYTSEDRTDFAQRWRAWEKALDGRFHRLRICAWFKCRRLFVRRGRSDYCELKHSAAAQRYRRKQRKLQPAKSQGESRDG